MGFSLKSYAAILFFGSLVCLTSPAAKMSTWVQALKFLNQPSGSEEKVLPEGHRIDEDLLALYQKELNSIQAKWVAENPGSKLRDKKSLRDSQNPFFHREVELLNNQVVTNLEKSLPKSKGRNYREAAKQALKKIDSHYLTRPESVYDFKDGDQIGFCFSRALLIHYWLLKYGVPQNEIAKIFTVGDLAVKKTFWKFHVAVMIPDETAGFLMVDPLHKEVLPYKEWLKVNSEYDIKTPFSRARFYVTSARKFLPSVGAYSIKQLEDPHYKNYFEQIAPLLGHLPQSSTKGVSK